MAELTPEVEALIQRFVGLKITGGVLVPALETELGYFGGWQHQVLSRDSYF